MMIAWLPIATRWQCRSVERFPANRVCFFSFFFFLFKSPFLLPRSGASALGDPVSYKMGFEESCKAD